MLKQQRLEELFNRPFTDEGENYRALCPVHEEKTPSFYIHKEHYLVHCFGCGTGGNIIDFLKEYKGVGQAQALSILGLTLEDSFSSFNAILPPKPSIYPESWLAPFRKEIHKYVIRRNFSKSTIEAAGGRYDHSTQRQVFPHRRRDGRLVGAIGRACKGQEPKWYYYWNYAKGRHLYRGFVPEVSDRIWIVEGVFDALWLNQHDIPAVAILGSKATDDQIEEIKDHYRDVVIALDNDEAGDKGRTHLYVKLHKSCNIYFPLWPEGSNDVMDTDPHKLDLLNVVQRAILSSSDNRS